MEFVNQSSNSKVFNPVIYTVLANNIFLHIALYRFTFTKLTTTDRKKKMYPFGKLLRSYKFMKRIVSEDGLCRIDTNKGRRKERGTIRVFVRAREREREREFDSRLE